MRKIVTALLALLLVGSNMTVVSACPREAPKARCCGCRQPAMTMASCCCQHEAGATVPRSGDDTSSTAGAHAIPPVLVSVIPVAAPSGTPCIVASTHPLQAPVPQLFLLTGAFLS